MAHDEMRRTDRRTFLQAGAVATASAMTLAPGADAQDTPAKADAPVAVLPKRKLGKTGIEVTLLEQGAARSPTPTASCKFAFARGVRLFDTAKVYGTEINFKKWFEQDAAIRKQIVLVTKDMPHEPSEMSEDGRPAAGGPRHRLHRLLLHPRAGRQHLGGRGLHQVHQEPRIPPVADKIRNSGKAKFIGFSAHHPQRARALRGGGRGRSASTRSCSSTVPGSTRTRR